MLMAFSTLSIEWSTLIMLTLVIVVWGLKVVTAVARSPLQCLPGPSSTNVIFGNAIEVMRQLAGWSAVGNFPEPYLSFAKIYGGAVYYRLFLDQTVQLSDPKAIQHVLSSSSFPRTDLARFQFKELFFGVGLMSSEGDLHHHQRKLLNPHFSLDHVKRNLRIFSRQAQRCCDLVLNPAANTKSTIDMVPVLQRLALSINGLATFGYDFDAHPEAFDAFQDYTLTPSPLLLLGVLTIPGFIYLPLRPLQRARRGRAAFRKIVDDVISTKLQQPSGNASRDLLDILLESDSTSHADAVVHTMTFLLGGQKTTSAGLAWVFLLLASHPSTAARVRDECQAVLQKYQNVEHGEALAALRFTKAVVQESLRLFPPAPFVSPRVATECCALPMVDGSTVNIPAGASVRIVPAVVHRDPKYWTNANDFMPERFIDGSPTNIADHKLQADPGVHYMSFGFGLKSCIGQRFAMAEMQVVVAILASRFEFKLTSDANPNPEYKDVTIVPANFTVTLQSWKAPSF
ncbi:Aste57867_1959 [Aphanomyces stellatus]|uniref:Aste57867_1959 protein n=1 Tax=Aphanomyces stellatus TaxID=120398 RepID=A0A485K7N8_9STRA|nr:hypothetical protein As57867_001957 [Aphanomyces stellatus]VFT79164.1 Aste57867_1959 [Aphanomyces stellatus]